MISKVLGANIAIFVGGAVLGGSLTYISGRNQKPAPSSLQPNYNVQGFSVPGAGSALEVLKYGHPGKHIILCYYNRLKR